MRYYIISLLIILFTLPHSAEAQRNRSQNTEKDSLKNGRYYEYWDSDSLILSAKGHFCHGVPCKKWKYYHYNGKRRMKVKYRDKLKIKYYGENGRLTHKGYAVLEWNEQSTHFYWQGIWKYYDRKRKLYRKALFEKGDEVKVLFGPEDPIYIE